MLDFQITTPTLLNELTSQPAGAHKLLRSFQRHSYYRYTPIRSLIQPRDVEKSKYCRVFVLGGIDLKPLPKCCAAQLTGQPIAIGTIKKWQTKRWLTCKPVLLMLTYSAVLNINLWRRHYFKRKLNPGKFLTTSPWGMIPCGEMATVNKTAKQIFFIERVYVRVRVREGTWLNSSQL